MRAVAVVVAVVSLACAACSAATPSSVTLSSSPSSGAGPAVPPLPALADWAPTGGNPDPSLKIPGIVTAQYRGGVHVLPTERVAYDHSPPIGGPHDGYWAACTGTVYTKAVRNEHMVHGLEHGAVWIAYNPNHVTGDALNKLRGTVVGKPYAMISPYPGLDEPISLQAWGHQLKVGSADDPRIDEFITALRANQNTTPEVGASCDALGPGMFDPDNPPPFDPTPPGPDAKPMNYQGTAGTQPDMSSSGSAAAPLPTR